MASPLPPPARARKSGVSRPLASGQWPCRDDLRDALQNGLRKIVMWTDQHDAGLAIFDTDPVDPFFNVNTPDDITEAERLLEAL